MPLATRGSPVKPLGESSGNAVMSPQQRGRSRNGHDRLGASVSAKEFELQDDDAKSLGRRTRSSKYFKALLDKPKPKQEAAKAEGGRGHKRAQSAINTYSIFPTDKSVAGRDNRQHEVSNKENRQPPPIWSQFATVQEPPSAVKVPLNDRLDVDHEALKYTAQAYSPSKQRVYAPYEQPTLSRRTRTNSRPRPKSENMTSGTSQGSLVETLSALRHSKRSQEHSQQGQERRKSVVEEGAMAVAQKSQPAELTVNKRGSRVKAAVAALNTKTKRQDPVVQSQGPVEPAPMDPAAVNQAFENMLESRNVPQNTRDKMRSLDTSIKADLIKQDKSSSGSASSTEGLSKATRPRVGKRANTEDAAIDVVARSQSGLDEESSKGRSRPRSRTFTFSKSHEGSPTKKQKSDRSRSRGRPRSGDLRPSESTTSLAMVRSESSRSWLFNRAQVFSTPEDCISYLRKREQPQVVEVGKIHKLKQLLRNETVDWVNDFITNGGMTEIIDLLKRTLVVEWREDHEDTLLHETLSCVKALSTTSLALQKLSSTHNTLFPALLSMLFSDEKKGPSEFTTRTLIIGLLSTYLSSAPTPDITTRARTVLSYLRDPSKPEAEQPLGFIASMHQSRPYRIWQKEISDVTKEVFWIFLHGANVIPYPVFTPSEADGAYCDRHFPKPHPPIPTAPYIGGVEWEATTYLTAHLDLLNGILAALPTQDERNGLRQELKDSSLEKVMGASLRTCKEKFYGSVHEALSVWVGAAREDGWDVKGVREGALPRTAPSSPRKNTSPAKKGGQEQAPKLDMPQLDVGECIGKHKAKEGFEGWF